MPLRLDTRTRPTTTTEVGFPTSPLNDKKVKLLKLILKLISAKSNEKSWTQLKINRNLKKKDNGDEKVAKQGSNEW